MAYLDDELAAEERHELEAHLAECPTCRASLERERADLSMVRRALLAPPAPDVLRARISRALDDEDRVVKKRRWSQYLLPSTAIMAAAAAIAVFVAVQAPVGKSTPKVAANVVHDVAKQGRRSLPLEVQGASTGQWLQRHFASDVEPPQFVEPQSELLGARLLPGAINGRDAAALSYQISLEGRPPFAMSVLVVRDLRGDELRDGTPVQINGRTLYVFETKDGEDIVSYVPRPGMGFMFIAPELTVNELLGLVSRTNLVAPR